MRHFSLWLLKWVDDLNRIKLGYVDLDEKMEAALGDPDEDGSGDTLVKRAESYYQKRPQLIALLQDLYKSYLYLSDRYIRALSRNKNRTHARQSSHVSALTDHDYFENDKEEDCWAVQIDSSDAESSLSYQNPLPLANLGYVACLDALVADLVIKNVECEILLDEVSISEQRCNDSSRKIELQKSLLEVLESERMILLHENARLGYRVSVLVEENCELASESVFVKRKAGELAQCMMKMREDQRVLLLSRKIEDLQGQIYGLEKRNKEYYEQLVKRDQEDHKIDAKKKKNGGEVTLEACLPIGKVKLMKNGNESVKGDGEKRVTKWWERVKNMDIFMCGMQTDIS
ncbi:kinase-interacting family protein-like isoform X2 [Rhodamnia argentea]|uniref:Kinase-interacting family protein-like isoform X2 n=1 Tax=Rhodamnia argentea TaxID=178133 RepID=A0A8B8NG47_9MYRT|nr:kinase-interacting family protein-like isoform X2 [Rhodamnia argentea]